MRRRTPVQDALEGLSGSSGRLSLGRRKFALNVRAAAAASELGVAALERQGARRRRESAPLWSAAVNHRPSGERFEAPPRFFLKGRVLMLYVGIDPTVTSLLTNVLGRQIAGS